MLMVISTCSPGNLVLVPDNPHQSSLIPYNSFDSRVKQTRPNSCDARRCIVIPSLVTMGWSYDSIEWFHFGSRPHFGSREWFHIFTGLREWF